MRPIDPKRLGEFYERAEKSPDQRHELAVDDGSRLVIEKHPEDGVVGQLTQLDAHGEEVLRTRTFAPAAERPVSFPPDLPFVAGLACTVYLYRAAGGSVLAQWEGVDDLAAVTDRVIEASLDDGWAPGPAPDGNADNGKSAVLVAGLSDVLRSMGRSMPTLHLLKRDGLTRMLTGVVDGDGKGHVALTDMPKRSSSGASAAHRAEADE